MVDKSESTVQSTEFSKSIDDYYATKNVWLDKVEQLLSHERSPEESREAEARARKRREQQPSYPEPGPLPKRYKCKSSKGKGKLTEDTDSDVAMGNLSIDDGEPLASDEEYIDLEDLNLSKLQEGKNEKPSSDQIIKIREALGLPKEKR